jgi:hypothetical protein
MSAELSPFSKRLVGYSTRLTPYPAKSPTMLAVKDQVLIAESISPVPFGRSSTVTHDGVLVGAFLKKFTKQPPRLVTTVFRGLPNPGGFEDVGIFSVTLPKGETVFKLTERFRTASSLAKIPPDKWSPNHVLIPAPAGGWCPHGPPIPIATVPPYQPLGGPGVEITVIDSGYIWPSSGWSTNPLLALCHAVYKREADWLKLNATGTTGQWQVGTANVVDANGDGKLDELAGHANFVAGVIAQQYDLPTLYIWNHNSGFAYQTPSDNFSTEAAICRSLVMSQQHRPTPVIQIGHETSVFDQVVSVVWGLAFKRIGAPLKRNLTTDVVLTAPAGNENDTVPRYPAALNATYPFVKSVASHDGAGTRSAWSNHGPWVTCSAVGESVESTFLHVKMPCEDGPAPSQDFTANSWAAWNGTSFAAPKVAAQVAARIAPGVNAKTAWDTLAACMPTGCPSSADIGIIFPF